MITLWGDAQDTINRLKPSEPLFMRVNSCDCMAYTLANLVPNVYELDDFQVRTPTDVIGQHIHLVKFDVTSSDGSSNGWNYEDGTFGPNEVTERINALNKVSGLQRFPGSTTPKTLTARDIRFFGPEPGAQPTNPDTGEWMGAQATVQRWYNDPLFNNIGVCSTNLDILCTIGEDAPYFKAELAGMGCPKFGICLPSAGFCSDNGARCAEDRKEQCGDPILAECHPTHDRTIRTVFTHDHFGPSTHQQTGLYAGVVAEPKDSAWRHNETGEFLGGWDEATQQPFPGRSITRNGVTVRDSGPTSWQAVIETPSTDPGGSYREFLFQAQDSALMYQPFAIKAYNPDVWTNPEQFYDSDLGPCDPDGHEPCGFCSYSGRCSNDDTKRCRIASPQPPGTGAPKPDIDLCGDVSATCIFGFGNLTACTPEDLSRCITWNAQQETTVESCNFIAGIPQTSWATLPSSTSTGNPINATNGSAEAITFNSATDNFSFNYRNEPLFPRTTNPFTGSPLKGPGTGVQGDLGFVYSSTLNRPSPRPNRCSDDLSQTCTASDVSSCPTSVCTPSDFCSDNYNLCTTDNTSLCDSSSATCLNSPWSFPYTPLTQGIEAGDPFTPLLRTYAGDDVQLRVLVGAHINPHNLTLHGLNWLKEPSFVDSGWRNSEVMGISEHFESITKVDPPYLSSAAEQPPYDKPWSDYLFQPGAAAIEQASGNWGLLRAYSTARDDLFPLPHNAPTDGGYEAIPVCPTNRLNEDGSVDCDKPGTQCYEVVALTAQQAFGSPLVYNNALGLENPNAMIFFNKDHLDCPADLTQCKLPPPLNPEPLVLRANAGDCIQVKLHNALVDHHIGPGVSSLQITSPQAKSNVSTEVGLRPQLVTYDLRSSDGTNVGFNPKQTAAAPGNPHGLPTSRTYVWYAGHIEAYTSPDSGPSCIEPDKLFEPTNCGGEGQPECCKACFKPDQAADPTNCGGERPDGRPQPPCCVLEPTYIPIEFGGSNLLPPDPLNHYLHGLFGGLIIEPEGATWEPPAHKVFPEDGKKVTGVEAVVHHSDHDGTPRSFREFVVFTQDDLCPAGNGPGSNGNCVVNSPAPAPVNAINYSSQYLGNGTNLQFFCDQKSCESNDISDVSCVLSENAFCNDGGGCKRCADVDPSPLVRPVFTACAGEEVRFRLLHPGGTNTNEVFELYVHNFSEAPYMTEPENCDPPTTHTNFYASQHLGTRNLCGSREFHLQTLQMMERMKQMPAVEEAPAPEAMDELEEKLRKMIGEEPAGPESLTTEEEQFVEDLWEESLNEWTGSKMGHEPGNHFDVLVESAGGPNYVPGDYLFRSYPAMHFNRGIWGIFRVEACDEQ